jgi:ribosome-binding factor A
MVRVNSLIMREISQIIHTEFQMETVAITIIDVKIVPDLRNGKVFYSVIGDEEAVKNAHRFFRKYSGRIKFLMGNRVTLKYTPDLTYHHDNSIERGVNLIDFMDEVDGKENPPQNHE